MKNVLFVGLCLVTFVAKAEETLKNFETNSSTQSVLATQSIQEPTVAAPANATAVTTTAPAAAVSAPVGCACSSPSCNNVVYKGQRNIAPSAVQKTVKVTLCEKCVDQCCNCTTNLKELDVPVCVPPCSCKESVTCSRNGKRVVLDYGKYEVVIHARRNGNIEVDYKKRLLGL